MISRKGKRGVVYYVKFVDAAGTQVKEKLGREDEGWTATKAKEALDDRLYNVRRGLRKPRPFTFATFAAAWLDDYPVAKGLKRSTREGYGSTLELHLKPAVGHLKLSAIDAAALDRYVAAKLRAGLQPRTVNRHLNLLSVIFKSAVRRELVRENPVARVERPREPRRRWTILEPAEVARVERAFSGLAEEAEEGDRAWIEQARVVFLTVLLAGLRRGEVLGLRWEDVQLADPDGARLRVRRTWVRGQEDTPKSERGERTIALGPRLASELFEQRGRSAFAGDDERVFCHPLTGGVLDHKHYAETLKLALTKAKVERAMRPFHDGRHSSITNAAAAGASPASLMARAGHADFATTQLYIDLAGETFREEAELLEGRLLRSRTEGASA